MVVEVQGRDRNHFPICANHSAGTDAPSTEGGLSLPSGTSLRARRVAHFPTGDQELISVPFLGRQKSRFALPARAAGFPALAAMGRHVGHRSPRTPH